MLVYILMGWSCLLTLLLVLLLWKQPLNKALLNQNQDLLNRLQAGDLKAFQVLQNSSKNPDQEYISRNDEAEAALTSTSGFGEILTDEDIRMHGLSDFGLGHDISR